MSKNGTIRRMFLFLHSYCTKKRVYRNRFSAHSLFVFNMLVQCTFYSYILLANAKILCCFCCTLANYLRVNNSFSTCK